jgi:hypothetical protein
MSINVDTSFGKLHLLIVNAESEIDPKICYLQAVEVTIYVISAYLLHECDLGDWTPAESGKWSP